jgi:AraC family transcriptional regulator of adaptative response / DNA-3-methyladenine glycosylase II
MHDAHPEEQQIERLVAEIRANPAAFPNVEALARAADLSESKLAEMFRTHYHNTPANFLVRTRIEAAQRDLLFSGSTIDIVANTYGYTSLEHFQREFTRRSGMSPSDYQRLADSSTFRLRLPSDYPTARVLAYLGRDPKSLTDRVEGDTWYSTLRLNAEQGAVIRVRLAEGHAECAVLASAQPTTAQMARIHAHVLASLGLREDPHSFEALVEGSPALAPLLEGQRGLRIPLIANPFDGLIWAITAQQITLGFAYTLRRRLIELTGQPLSHGLWLVPTPQQLAQRSIEELAALSFSRAKARYLIENAQAVHDQRLPLEQLAQGTATRAERLLLAQRGIGPWSANYLMLRSFGFLDCVPLGDTGLTSGLQRFFKLEQRPDKSATLQLMEQFRPYRSLATFHLWQRQSMPG